jgi:hypothetical protein
MAAQNTVTGGGGVVRRLGLDLIEQVRGEGGVVVDDGGDDLPPRGHGQLAGFADGVNRAM